MHIPEFQRILRKKGIDAALFLNLDSSRHDANLDYFTGYSGVGALVVPKSKMPFIAAPQMEIERARSSAVHAVAWKKGQRLFPFLKAEMNRRGIRAAALGIDKQSVSLAAYSSLKKVFKGSKQDVARDCGIIRAVKTPEELDRIRQSCRTASRIISSLIDSIGRSETKTESEAVAFLDYETRKTGCELSFEPIVASGIGGREPHYRYQNIKLRKGFCVIDFGVRQKGYCSDITRTIYLGRPSAAEKAEYNAVLGAQLAAIEAATPGAKCSQVYDAACKALGSHAKYFTHGLGHGIGVEIHELPNLTMASKDTLKQGMAFTIEPGIYLKRHGIRIEDDIIMGKRAEVVTKVSKELINF